ncbi:dipeptide ABC transporter ATP-binding protein [Micromonospora parathelypteridis]|uniref:Peptide/nickel transport system ATP-binding protein n=1 Tax=Micromonospora parathelypteridis TaxID=1839617 RepID=A0A840VH43_9ACTN|nr:ABC transporter ATP-binding protein [Micromonospora parathelypteridis]MBB5475975.1 peptide/nickel transport system ATP-binding protein [Micromonospora parathelypteridis]GGO32241.1 ABC transporter ATP-binding protein [Micromonospora parathelypteridis]
MATLVAVEDLHVDFDTPTGRVAAVRGISFTVERGECVAIVGESGSGKSVTARTLVGLAGPGAQVRAARLELADQDVRGHRPRDWRRIRGRLAGLVLQDALVSLDPLRTVGAEIGEVLTTHGIVGRRERAGRVAHLLDQVHLPDPQRRARQYPHQLSGGLRQRALIASAIAGEPALLIADEPTTALDVTVQAQILRLLAERRAAGVSLLLISHDLAVVAQVADRVLVMRDGRIVEHGPTGRLLRAPTHPYTRQLLAAVPSATSRGRRLGPVAGASRDGGASARPALPARPAIRLDDTVLDAGGLTKRYGDHTVVRDVSFSIARGETLGLVGESGSGKSTVARIVAGLLDADAGTVTFEGTPWAGVPERTRRPSRRRLQLISQDPLSSFDPRYTVGRVVAENLDHDVDRSDRRDHVVDLLRRVGLGADLVDRHPRQLSGGQRQRVAIARAIAPRPTLIICDEPVSALDVSVQAQVLDLLADLRATDGTALLFISHDLGVVHHLSDRVLVMHDGAVVEQGPVGDVFTYPRHDYTRSLLDALPTLVTVGRPQEEQQ